MKGKYYRPAAGAAVALTYAAATIFNPLTLRVLAADLVVFVLVFIWRQKSESILWSAVRLLAYTLPYTMIYSVGTRVDNNFPLWPLTLQLSLVAYGLGDIVSLIIYSVTGAPLLTLPLNPESFGWYTLSTLSVPVAFYAIFGQEGMKYVKAAIESMRRKSGEIFEHAIPGITRDIEWNALLIDDKSGSVKGLVEPGIHYGPLKGISSSVFPQALLEESRDTLIPLHGCGSHERNLVFSKDSREYAKIIAREATKRGVKCTPLEPKVARYNGWTTILLGCTEKPLIIAFRRDGSEDVPCDLLGDMARNVIFVDGHCITTDNPSHYGLRDALQHALMMVEECDSPRCCLVKVNISDDLMREANICQGWIAVYKQCCRTNCASIAIIPSNNVERSAAPRYWEHLGERVHIITIDDHSCIVDETNLGELRWSERLASLIKRLETGCTPSNCSLKIASGKKKLRVWGERSFYTLSKLLKRAAIAWKIVIITYLIPIIVGLALLIESLLD
ncbi:MAG: DUF2070 family protein [Desulfurococcales archaeon]|nr:DUF2070 family protein [Desulfurococcales archaeon]